MLHYRLIDIRIQTFFSGLFLENGFKKPKEIGFSCCFWIFGWGAEYINKRTLLPDPRPLTSFFT